MPGPPAYGFRSGRLEPANDSCRVEVGTFAYLDRRERGFERPAGAAPTGPSTVELMEVFPHRGTGFAGTEHVLVHGAHVPVGTISAGCPVVVTERAEKGDRSSELASLEVHCLAVRQGCDGGDVGCRRGHLGSPLLRWVVGEHR